VYGRFRRMAHVKTASALKSKRQDQKNIWYTGENQRPPSADFDLSFSFDLDPLGGTNIYLPLLLTSLDWFEDGQAEASIEGRRAGKIVTPRAASSPRSSNVAARPKFVCAFVGNQEPMRMRALAALETIGNVDIYGAAFGGRVLDKYSIAKHYKFMLCFENDLYPGYVTEKPLEAWVSGCIPLWRGIDSAEVLNPNALLNAATFDSLASFVNAVAELDDDAERLAKMGSNPILSREVSLRPAKEAMKRLVDE